MTTILGIETSCDETSASVVIDGVDVLSNVVASQIDLHAKYGGVVPEIASRAHVERLDSVIEEALEQAGLGSARSSSSRQPEPRASARAKSRGASVATDSTDASSSNAVDPAQVDSADAGQGAIPDIDAIAVTNRPGLVGALLIGVSAAKTLSWAWNKPLIGVDHIRAHAYSAAIDLPAPPWPAVGLIVSGGHTSLFRIDSPTQIELLGATTDDAAGEAFDKVAATLGLSYPGGPSIQRAARDGNPKAVDFPRTMLAHGSLDFSFSGIKTAVLYHVHGHGKTSGGLESRSPTDIADIAASFQQAVVDVLVRKTMLAVARTGLSTVVLGGGVAANTLLRESLKRACAERDVHFHAAKMVYCTDNAAMIASLGYHQLIAGDVATLELAAYPTGSVPKT